jgi:RND family efflux transporter MFP subunit
VSGVVTRLVQPAGATPETLQRLLFVSGKPVFAFVSATPLWKNLSTSLSSGAQRVNVTALQKALKQQGYYTKAVNGRFTAATKKALKRWQKANGLSATGVVDVTKFVWMPTGSVLTGWNVSLGSHVSSGTALASVVSPSKLSASALISQADIADLKVGQKAQMTIDGYDSDAFTGRISFISSEPASSSSASSTSTQYSITITSDDLPELAKSGMTGTLDIVIEQAADVLMVPTTAVSGSSSTSFVRVMQDGRPVFRQVQSGMATSSYTEITSGLAVGESVVTGQYTDGADSSSSSSSQSTRSGGSILQGGGAFPAGGPPAGGGFPGGGAQSGGGQ